MMELKVQTEELIIKIKITLMMQIAIIIIMKAITTKTILETRFT